MVDRTVHRFEVLSNRHAGGRQQPQAKRRKPSRRPQPGVAPVVDRPTRRPPDGATGRSGQSVGSRKLLRNF